MAAKGTILARILARKREEVAAAIVTAPLAQIRAMAADRPPARDFVAALAAPGISVIAEIKRGSPSAGAFAPSLDAAALATTYESAGAAVISVVTDRDFFQGAPADLRARPVVVDNSLVNEINVELAAQDINDLDWAKPLLAFCAPPGTVAFHVCDDVAFEHTYCDAGYCP